MILPIPHETDLHAWTYFKLGKQLVVEFNKTSL